MNNRQLAIQLYGKVQLWGRIDAEKRERVGKSSLRHLILFQMWCKIDPGR